MRLWALCKCEEEIREGWRCFSGPRCCSDVTLVRGHRVNPAKLFIVSSFKNIRLLEFLYNSE